MEEALPERQKERYDNIDGLRAYASLGIVMMHVLANGFYDLDGFLFDKLIPSFADLVFLFMMVSSFSMCCGYYERVSLGKITPISFYRKRYSKIWPFFAVLVLLDLCISCTPETLMEGFANLTLCFGLLPNANISVIGVSWTLGVIFVFYMLFPFFCFLLSSKKQGWLVMGITVVWSLICSEYFFDQVHVVESFSPRSNILYVAVYFVGGGMIYLYRNEIVRFFRQNVRWLLLVVLGLCVIGYYTLGNKIIMTMLLYGAMLLCAVSRGSERGLLNNRFTRFISKISMEIYLSHMVIFRVIEKLKLQHLFPSALLSFCIVLLMTLLGTIVFALCVNWGISFVEKVLNSNRIHISGRS